MRYIALDQMSQKNTPKSSQKIVKKVVKKSFKKIFKKEEEEENTLNSEFTKKKMNSLKDLGTAATALSLLYPTLPSGLHHVALVTIE